MVDFMIKECLFERVELGSILTRKEALFIRSGPCLNAHSQIGYNYQQRSDIYFWEAKS